MTTYLTFDQVLAIHGVVARGASLRDAGLVQSAVGRPQATAFGADAYPSVWEKAAALLHSLARNHGFDDGNKRVAWVAAMTFLEVNGHPLDPGFDQRAAEQLVVAVADGRCDSIGDIARRLKRFTTS